MGKIKSYYFGDYEFQENSINPINNQYDFENSWECGVIETLSVMPVCVLTDLSNTKELGYFAKLVLHRKGEDL